MYKITNLDSPLYSLTIREFVELLLSLPNNSNPEASEIMNKEECSALTGYSIEAINKMICNKEIPYYKPKKKVFFRRSEVIEWIFSNRVGTKDEYLKTKDMALASRKGGCI